MTKNEGSSSPQEDPNELERVRAEQQLLHALLTGLHEDEASRENRIAATLKRFENSQSHPRPETQPRRRSRTMQWLAAAVAVMIAGLIWNQVLQPTPLTAAVDRVVVAAAEPVTRIYDVHLQARLRGGVPFSKRGRLYTQSTKQFVIAIGDRKRPMVFGTNGERDWFVIGNRQGYISETLEHRPKSPFIEERMHRFMLTNQFLQSLSDNYEVELLDEPTPSSVDRPCSALLGKRIVDDRRSPSEVRIWADRKKGVPLHVVLTWDQPNRFKPQRMVLEYVGEKTVSDDYYTLDHQVSMMESR